MLECTTEKPDKDEIAKLTNDIMMHIAELLPEEYHGRYVK
jgi:hypothetical protein